MDNPTAQLFREVARQYVRSQRQHARCDDGRSTVQCHVLTELQRQHGLTQQALASRLGLDKGWVSRAVDALVADGSVSKQSSARDRRSVTLGLTPLGHRRAAALEQELNGHAAGLLHGLSAQQDAQIQQSLRWLLAALARDGALPDGPPPCTGPAAAAAHAAPVFRRAAAADWVEISDLLTASDLPLDGAQAHLDNFLLGHVDGKLACVGGLEVAGGAALLRSMAVAAPLRNRGCGRYLLAQLMQLAGQRGVTRLYLLTTTAASYFRRMGFVDLEHGEVPEAIGRSRQFHGACPASATLLTCAIGASSSFQPFILSTQP